MPESLVTLAITVVLLSAVVIPYWVRFRRRERKARANLARLEVAGLQAASSVHPHIDLLACIGCGSCVRVCPEGDVLGLIGGKATLVHGAKCVGHGLCEAACPVGAITLVMASPGRSAELPVLSQDFETSLPNLFIVGELSGVGLIRNAVLQGRQAVEAVARRRGPHDGLLDVVVVGAGPAGLSAGLTAMEQGLRTVVLEQGGIGGTILQYPRRKVVLTSPVEIPLWGKLKFAEATKEQLLAVWEEIIRRTGLVVQTEEKMTDVQRFNNLFRVVTSKDEYIARHLVLALGRRGTPRKLGVPGESLSKTTYRLIDAASYNDMDLLVVGGGDSAVEAAVGLALQRTNRVTLAYRKSEFTRIKERNQQHLAEHVRQKSLQLALNTEVEEIREDSVCLVTNGERRTIRNDYVFVCAGGEMPFELLQRIGIAFHRQSVPAADQP